MLKEDIEKLVVLEICEFNQPGPGVKNRLESFLNGINPFIATTCKRHVYLFSSDDLEKMEESHKIRISQEKEQENTTFENELLTFCNTYSNNSTIYKAWDAYKFLVFWVSGARNDTQYARDQRVKGEVVQKWQNYNNIQKSFLNKIMDAVFSDVALIHTAENNDAEINRSLSIWGIKKSDIDFLEDPSKETLTKIRRGFVIEHAASFVNIRKNSLSPKMTWSTTNFNKNNLSL